MGGRLDKNRATIACSGLFLDGNLQKSDFCYKCSHNQPMYRSGYYFLFVGESSISVLIHSFIFFSRCYFRHFNYFSCTLFSLLVDEMEMPKMKKNQLYDSALIFFLSIIVWLLGLLDIQNGSEKYWFFCIFSSRFLNWNISSQKK